MMEEKSEFEQFLDKLSQDYPDDPEQMCSPLLLSYINQVTKEAHPTPSPTEKDIEVANLSYSRKPTKSNRNKCPRSVKSIIDRNKYPGLSPPVVKLDVCCPKNSLKRRTSISQHLPCKSPRIQSSQESIPSMWAYDETSPHEQYEINEMDHLYFKLEDNTKTRIVVDNSRKDGDDDGGRVPPYKPHRTPRNYLASFKRTRLSDSFIQPEDDEVEKTLIEIKFIPDPNESRKKSTTNNIQGMVTVADISKLQSGKELRACDLRETENGIILVCSSSNRPSTEGHLFNNGSSSPSLLHIHSDRSKKSPKPKVGFLRKFYNWFVGRDS